MKNKYDFTAVISDDTVYTLECDFCGAKLTSYDPDILSEMGNDAGYTLDEFDDAVCSKCS